MKDIPVEPRTVNVKEDRGVLDGVLDWEHSACHAEANRRRRAIKETTMTNRRAFCRTVAGAAGALVLAPPFASARAQEARRQVTIGGRRVKVIDIHCHCVIPEAAEVVKNTPLAKAGGGGGGNQVLGPQRLALMDKTGVDVQALTINGFWWYEADRDLAQKIVQAQNEGLAKRVKTHPDRFVAMASVALQFPDLAAQQIEDRGKRLGQLGPPIGGQA